MSVIRTYVFQQPVAVRSVALKEGSVANNVALNLLYAGAFNGCNHVFEDRIVQKKVRFESGVAAAYNVKIAIEDRVFNIARVVEFGYKTECVAQNFQSSGRGQQFGDRCGYAVVARLVFGNHVLAFHLFHQIAKSGGL